MADEFDDLSDLSDELPEIAELPDVMGNPDDNIDPDLGDLSWSDEDVPSAPPSALGALGTLGTREKKLLEKYEDLEVDDADEIEEMAELMNDRRAFSERLENDPEFRAKYIAKEEARRKRLERDENEDDGADDIIRQLQGGYTDDDSEYRESIDTDALHELEDLDDFAPTGSRGQGAPTGPGASANIHIQHVDKLVINMTFR